MGTIYDTPQEYPAGWQGDEGDVYAAGSTFKYGTFFGPNTVFEGQIVFDGGCDTPPCDPFIHVAEGTIIGEESYYKYVMFMDGDSTIVGQPYIDGGDNQWNGADQDYPEETIGESQSLSSDCCSQSLSSDGEEEPAWVFSNRSCGPCEFED